MIEFIWLLCFLFGNVNSLDNSGLSYGVDFGSNIWFDWNFVVLIVVCVFFDWFGVMLIVLWFLCLSFLIKFVLMLVFLIKIIYGLNLIVLVIILVFRFG